jgi:CHAT domain-containing protein/Flp pilus assembly protein TadD
MSSTGLTRKCASSASPLLKTVLLLVGAISVSGSAAAFDKRGGFNQASFSSQTSLKFTRDLRSSLAANAQPQETSPKKYFSFAFTPGFSQVTTLQPFDWKPFKRFPSALEFRDTWLKPGVNERCCVLRLQFTFEAKPRQDAPQPSSPTALTAGQPIDRRIAAGQTHSYRIQLAAAQYLDLVVDQRGIDLALTLFGPDGGKLSEIDSPNGSFGPERLLLIARTSGAFRLEVRSLKADAVPGAYQIKIAELRSVQTSDQSRVTDVNDAQRALSQIVKLASSGDAGVKQALGEADKALLLWQRLGDQYWQALTFDIIGVLHGLLKEDKEALSSFQQALALARTIHDRRTEAGVLNEIGELYNTAGEKQKAVESFNHALPIARELGDRSREGAILDNLGAVQESLGDQRAALEFFRQAAFHHRETGNRSAEVESLTRIGELYRALGQKDKALATFLEALPLRRAQAEVPAEVFTLNQIASLYDELGEKQKALDFYQQALAKIRSVGAPIREAETLLRMGLIYKSMGQKQKALEMYSLALPILSTAKDQDSEASTLIGMGVIYDALGDWEKELEVFRRALPLFRATGNRRGEGKALKDIAAVLNTQGERQQALANYNEALLIFRAIKDREDEAVTLNSLGVLYRSLGEFQKSLEAYNAALTIRRELKDRDGEATTLSNLGLLYTHLGEEVKAVGYYKQALELHRATANRDGEAGVLLNIGALNYKVKRWKEALDYDNQALQIFRAEDNRRDEAEVLNNLAMVYEGMQDKQTAASYYQQALSLTRTTGHRSAQATVLGNLGVLYESLGDKQKAQELFNQSLGLHRALGDLEGTAITLRNLSSLWEDRNPALAIFFGKQAVNTFQQMRANIRTLDREIQNSFRESVEDVYRDLAEILIAQGRLPEAQKVLGLLKEEEFFEFVRRDTDSASLSGARVTFSAAEAELEKRFAEIADKIVAIGNRRSALLAMKERSPEEEKQLSDLEAQLETANQVFQKFVNQLEVEFKQTQANNHDVTALRESQTLKDSLRELDAVALYTIVGREKYSVILITPDVEKAYEYKITAADLNQKIFAFRQALQRPDTDPLPLARELYQILIGPELLRDIAQTTKQTIVWSLDGALRYLPVAALHDGQRYFIEKYQNVVITLASRDHLKDAVSAKWQALGLGVSKAQVLNTKQAFAPLPGVREELSAIVKETGVARTTGVLPGTILLDEQFTADAMKSALRLRGNQQPFKLVHIASHFNFEPGDETKSFLLLGGGKILTLWELKNMSQLFSKVELLTLSACNTATGGAGEGKEVEGFAVLTQRQGAEAIIATLWSVADQSTSRLMQDFYRLRERSPKMSKAEALRQAQLALLRPADQKDAKAPYAHPFYWAPFILIGNWK